MRVAYVCADLGVPVCGSKGCSIHVQEIVRSFLRRGDQVELFVARLGGKLAADLSQCTVHEFRPQTTHDTASREVEAQRVAERIFQALADRGPFDLIYERHSLWSAAGPRFGDETGTPSILEINAPLIREQRLHRELVDVEQATATAQVAFAQATSLAAVSTEVAEAIQTDFPIDRHKLHVVPNGVDTQRFSPEIPAVLPSAGFSIGFSGSLKPWHGVETLLEAFCILHRESPSSRLVIIGDGPMRAQLEQTYCPAGSEISECVQWIGSVSPEAVPGYLTSLDVAVAPYPDLSDFYFSPLKVYEYMACGLPTVASNIGQLKTIITHRVDGFLVQPCSEIALAGTLSALTENSAVCTEVGRRARKRAVENFSWDQVLAQSLASIAPMTTGKQSGTQPRQAREVMVTDADN